MISVSVIIPAWNESTALKATIDALLDTDYDKKKCEVIVVAGGDDNTYEIARDLSPAKKMFSRYVVLLQGPHGKNAAIQEGIKEARNDIIVLLDADTVVSKRWLKSMVCPLEQGSCDLTIANPEPVRKNWVSDYYMITKTYLMDSITMYSGHAMAFKAAVVVNRLEYFFDAGLKVGVDYLLAKRFMEQKRRIRFVKSACVTTHLPSSLKYFILTELRWMTALISIRGVDFLSLGCNSAVVAALVLLVPLFKTLLIASLVFHSVYILKRVRIFAIASRQYETNSRNVIGFVMLSYVYHVIGFICYIRYFLRLSRESYLYQGQRY